jgi:photosystem II stability/assembly factor-like uncharacterized protein
MTTTGGNGNRIREALLGGLRWRLIGPYRAGRVVAVAADPVDRLTFWFGSTGGGVWKTGDGAATWRNTSDGFFGRASVGALAVAPSDPNVVYAGTGEACIRSNVAPGDGVYRTTDAGRSWRHLGLAATRHISRVRVDPADPDRVYVAAFGHAFGPNDERGVYRSTDGGRAWERILHRDGDTGAADLAVDPHNPRVLYASMWRARRWPWTLESGGPGSGLWRSGDGGDTWEDLSRRPGFPEGPLGRIGVCASPARPGRLWAVVEARRGALLRSDDGGDHWERLSEQGELRWRAWYYSHVFADPTDADTVWALDIDVWRSIDGGRSFEVVHVPHGDAHDLWIDPSDPSRLILGCDGGALASFDGGVTWSSVHNQPTAELYHVSTDTRTPYRVYAAQQDNTTVCVPSHSDLGVIGTGEVYEVGGGESGHIAVRPDDPDVVFAGNYMGHITRYDHRRRSAQPIDVWPEETSGGGADLARYRFNWTAPILLSPHDPGVLYQAGNHVFRSDDEGSTWREISPDLTRNDPSKLGSSGGELTADNTGAEYCCSVFALAESPLRAGVLWAGTDDGLVHVSEDAGGTWTAVTPPDMPEWTWVSAIEPSRRDAAAAYVVGDHHRLDDFAPYLWRTTDLGRSWERLDAGLADDELCRVLREDPDNADLLYLGTERGVQVSFDAGASWSAAGGDLPLVPVHDLVVHGDDLVAATHGRSIWILEDLPALREQATLRGGAGVHLYRPKRLVRYPSQVELDADGPAGSRRYGWAGAAVFVYELRRNRDGDVEAVPLDAGANRPDGVQVLYWLDDPGDTPLSLVFTGPDRTAIRTFSSEPEPEPKPEAESERATQKPDAGRPKEPVVPRRAGLNRFVWDMRHEPGTIIETGRIVERHTPEQKGPVVPPGTYQVSVELGEHRASASFEIAPDPRNPAGPDDVRAAYDLSRRLWEATADLHAAVNTIRDVKGQLERWCGEAVPGEVRAAATSLRDDLTAVEDVLVPVEPKGSVDLSNPPRLETKLLSLFSRVDMPARPPASAGAVAERILGALHDARRRLGTLLDGPLADLDRLLADRGYRVVEPRSERPAPTVGSDVGGVGPWTHPRSATTGGSPPAPAG